MKLIRIQVQKKNSDVDARAGALVGSSIKAWLFARVDDVATDLFVALQF
jgi:hypothetical protein